MQTCWWGLRWPSNGSFENKEMTDFTLREKPGFRQRRQPLTPSAGLAR